MKASQKVVIAAVPYVETHRALAAPAVLKASLINHGIDCVAIDLNVDLIVKLDNHPNKALFLDFFYNKKIDQAIVNDLSDLICYCTDKILYHSPTIIGLSLFCYTCQTFTTWLCAAIRNRNPNIKIVVGGPGLKSKTVFSFAEHLRRRNLIDDFIFGDAEISIKEYVDGNLTYPGINEEVWTQVPNFQESLTPDFSDYNFFWYKEPSLPIIDSRGCVRDCEFCDVPMSWEKFQYLPADKIFSQMLDQISKYNIYHFDFRSSITNGNLREFIKLINLIAEFNRNKFRSEQVGFDCSFIVRSSKSHPEELWQALGEANAHLFLGVESLSEKIRKKIGKNFSNLDLEHHIEMARKYKVPVDLLFIGAYIGETEEDWDLTKKWFRDYSSYAKNPIANIGMAMGTGVLPGSRLEKELLQIKTREEILISSQLNEQQRLYLKDLRQLILDCNFNILS